MDIISEAKKVLEVEKNSIEDLMNKLDENFVNAIELMLNCDGRVIIMGVGKSGLIGRKISATFASTGTPSFYVHPGEGMHGDLGMVTSKDIVILISNSGETDEVLKVIPTLKKMGVKIISLTGKMDSSLAGYSDIAVDSGVEKEACALNVVPTASTTTVLALGDALASVLLKLRGFDESDFAFLHPGGSLGRKLLLRVEDVMHSGDANAVISNSVSMKEAIMEISTKGLGAVSIVDDTGCLRGIVTDGDLRRAIEIHDNLMEKSVEEVMTKDPVRIHSEKLAAEAFHLMENRPNQISVLPVVDDDGKPVGMVRIHDLVKAGVD